MTDYANLGFVPGGSTGLLAFTLDPRNTLPKDINAESAWELPALQPVNTLDDFAAIIVATENADIARSWIEQARLYLNTTPMILVVSAQNEPLIRPYYDSSPRQIQGLLIGYPAAVIYETILGRSTQTTARWTPFAVGLSVGVLLILIGAIVNLLVGFIIRSKENKRTREQP